MEVSPKENTNIIQMLYFAQSVVIYPLRPLIDPAERTLTPKYKKALTRIFRILDTDNDNKLNDSEINLLQQRVYESELSENDIKGLKDMVKDEDSQNYHSRHLNLEGFFIVHRKLLLLMKFKNSWVSRPHAAHP